MYCDVLQKNQLKRVSFTNCMERIIPRNTLELVLFPNTMQCNYDRGYVTCILTDVLAR